jgi:hypothetical protein
MVIRRQIMGIQGHVYNVLGLELEAKVEEEDALYTVEGKTVFNPCPDHPGNIRDKSSDFINDVMSVYPDRSELSILLQGVGGHYKGRHFNGRALVGYAVAQENNFYSSTELPSPEIIERLKPGLIVEIKEKLGLEVDPDNLRLYLHWDTCQCDQS